MRILLVDVDSVIPNLALMRISSYYKGKGDDVFFQRLSIPYFPKRNKVVKFVDSHLYDACYMSCVFEGSLSYVSMSSPCIIGGSGYSLETKLSNEFENCSLDYSLYPDNDTSYGFLTRGCVRKCWFCKVPKMEGHIRQVACVEDIVRHSKTKFMDNNILALPTHLQILHELVEKQYKIQFNQGLDIRLLTKKSSGLLSKLNYLGDYVFAFDNYKELSLIKDSLSLLKWRNDWQVKFFIYVHPKMDDKEIFSRINFLKEQKCLGYVMRDISCYFSKNKKFYSDLAAWVNQPGFFKNMSFEEFIYKRNIGRFKK